MEALRHNQALAARAAAAAAAGGAGGTGAVGGGGGAPRVIPVRESSLTNLFKGVLQGHGNLVMSVHVSQHPDEYDTNRHTLRFAALASRVQVAAAAPALPPPAPRPPGEGRVPGGKGSSRYALYAALDMRYILCTAQVLVYRLSLQFECWACGGNALHGSQMCVCQRLGMVSASP